LQREIANLQRVKKRRHKYSPFLAGSGPGQ
jgi:hypothetical protein